MAAGARAVVWGTGLRGVRSVFVGGQPILDDLTTSAGVCGHIRLSPGQARRELADQRTTWIEDIMVLPTHPGAVLQWTPQSPCLSGLTLSWDIRGVDPGMCAIQGSFLEVEAGDGDEQGPLVFLVTPEPEAWTVEGRADGAHVTLRVKSRPGECITLAAMLGEDRERIQGTLGALEHLGAHETRLSSELEEARRGALTLGTGQHEVDAGFEWSKARLRAALHGGATGGNVPLGLIAAASPDDLARCEPPSAPDLLWTVLGWLATGDFTAAEQGVRALAGHEAFGWACGQYACWSGDDRVLTDLAAPLSDWISLVAGAVGRSAGYGLEGHTALAVAYDGRRDGDAATFHRREAHALRSISNIVGPASAEAPNTPLDDPGVLAARIGLCPAVGPQGDPDTVYALWRTLVATATREAGVWASPIGTESHRTALAALTPAGLLFGILGARAEAAAGRLHLAPRLPKHLTRFRAENIRVGTALVHFTYENEGTRHTYCAEQSEGATPINLVLKPRLMAASLARASVDGAAADLEWKAESAGEGAVQIQLPLDTRRTLTLEVLETSI